MQQLALICSFDSFQPADADKLPGHLVTIWNTLSQLPAEHRLGVRDLSKVIDGHVTSNGSSPASTAEKKPSLLQDAPAGPDSSSESDEEMAVRKALHTGPQPVKAHDKATAAATSSWANNLADAMRPAPGPVNVGDQRAANKRLQLQNKLKRNHEAAGNQGASQKAEPAVPTLAEVEPITEDLSLPQDDELLSMLAPAIAKKQSRKMLKRARRRAAAAAAAETAAGSAGLQLDDPSDGPSTAEGTSSSSAASLVGSEAGTPPASGQADVAQQSTAAAGATDVPALGLAADDPASSSKQGEEAAQSNAASSSCLPAADSSAPAAIASSSSTAETDSTLAPSNAASESAQPDSKQPAANGTDSGSAQSGTTPDTSKQTPGATTASPAAAPAPQADAAQAQHEPRTSAEHTSDASPRTSSPAPPSPTPPQASSVAATSNIPSADTAPGSAAGKDAGVQPPKSDSPAQQKLEQRPSAGVATAAPPPPPPAAIAAHRPAPKAVLRASAAPYTPLSSKVVLADSNKAPAVGVRPGPAANSGTQDKGKRKVPAGICLSSATHWSMCL